MCLGVPGKITEIDGSVAKVDFWGLRREVRLDLVDQPVAVGDYVLNHVGYAIRRIPDDEIGETLDLYDQLLKEAEAQTAAERALFEDPMAADVRDEIAAAGRHVTVPDEIGGAS